jgi:hypothetical protein
MGWNFFFLSSIEGEQKEIGIKSPILHLRIDLNKKSLLQTSQFESQTLRFVEKIDFSFLICKFGSFFTFVGQF